MPRPMTDIDEIRDAVHTNARDHGFWTHYNPKALQELGRLFMVIRTQAIEAQRIQRGTTLPRGDIEARAAAAHVQMYQESTPEDPVLLEKLGRLMLVVTEIAEAGDAILAGDEKQLTIELADSHLRLFDIEAGWNLKSTEAMGAKMTYNATRPFMHGKRA